MTTVFCADVVDEPKTATELCHVAIASVIVCVLVHLSLMIVVAILDGTVIANAMVMSIVSSEAGLFSGLFVPLFVCLLVCSL